MGFSVGMWVWDVPPLQGPANITAYWREMTGLGIRHAVVKVTDGAGLYNGDNLGPVFRAGRAEGLHLWAWGYDRDARYSDPEVEGTLLGQRATVLEADGVVVDVEAEWQPHDESVEPFMDALRLSYPKPLPIYLSSYSTMSAHSDFPWQDFAMKVDGFMPQVYQVPVADWISRAMGEFESFGKTVIPTGLSDGEIGSVEQTQAFLAYCRTRDVTCNLWVWQHATQAMKAEIQRATLAGTAT